MQIEYDTTLDDCRRVLGRIMKSQVKSSWLQLLIVLCVFGFMYLGWLISEISLLFACALALSAIFIFIVPRTIRSNITTKADSLANDMLSGRSHRHTTMELRDDFIAQRSDDGNYNETPWHMFDRVEVDDIDVVLRIRNIGLVQIPRRAFTDQRHMDMFIDRARSLIADATAPPPQTHPPVAN